MSGPESWRAEVELERRGQLRAHVAMGVAVFVVSALLAITSAGEAWVLIAIAEAVAALLLWTAFRGDSITAAVATMLAASGLSVFGDERLQLGSVLSAVLAIVVGEILAEHRAVRDAADLRIAANDSVPRIVTPGLAAAAAAAAALVVAEVPGSGRWALAAAAALAIVAVATYRRSNMVEPVPLPPPPPPMYR